MSKTAHAFSLSSYLPDQPHDLAEFADELSNLPAPDTRRWDSKRKAKVVEAVRSGLLTIEQATHIYDMSIEEFLTWQNLYDRYGANGLTVKHALKHRHGN